MPTVPLNRWLLLLALVTFTLAAPVRGQDDGLTASDIVVSTRQDPFGQTYLAATGQLTNAGPDAYTGITVLAEVYDSAGTLIGEGLGFPVNACGAGLLPSFVLQPGEVQPFEARLELYQPDGVPGRVTVIPQATATQPSPVEEVSAPGLTRLARAEVADVEWIDSRALRYGVGCPRDLFTELDWYHHSLRANVTLNVVHPHVRDVTPELLNLLRLNDPIIFDQSRLTFPPRDGRIVFQDATNRFITADPTGAFQRVLYNNLHNRTLQGIIWLEGNRFLAYYYGATGDPVLYFTADTNATYISMNPLSSVPSVIVPGASPDGRRAVIAGTYNGRTGYFLKLLTNQTAPQPLFDADPPGNNWPQPLFTVRPGETASAPPTEIIYIARPVDGQPRLQCYHLPAGGPVDLGPLPLRLTNDDRARWWLSPDGQRIALASTGARGGLWLIELSALPSCVPQPPVSG